MKLAFTAVLLFFLAFSDGQPFPDDDNWELRKDKDNIKVFARQLEDSGLKGYKVVTVLDAPLETISAALTDVEAYPQWMTNVKATRILKRENAANLFYYIEIEAPWPISNRDNIIHLRVDKYPGRKSVEIVVEGLHDYLPEQPGIVRIRQSNGVWRLTQKENGETEVVSLYVTDPSGHVPLWVVNMFVVDNLYHSLLNFKTFFLKQTRTMNVVEGE